ncbi:MAG TPA: MFS transporter, partial [Steroidobacteraceae bacterium]|nr:MFS transporter [Steroidobacteraceae bacterium]
RPVRDTMATVFGVQELQRLFTGTFIVMLLCAPAFSWCAGRFRLTRLLPGVFWFLLGNLLVFYLLFRTAPQSRWVAAAYFWWFSAINLILISVFWTFMADLFSAGQATRLFAFIAAGGELGAIAGPIVTRSLAESIGIDGLLLVAIVGFALIILLVQLLVREKARLHATGRDEQQTTLDHSLPGNPWRGFRLLSQSRYMMGQAAFMVLMTWIATILYFLQTDLIARTYSGVARRTIAFADVDLFVNVCSAIILLFGLGRVLRRFGVTASLLLTPLIMLGACVGILIAPTFFMVQTARALQRITQYAIARPSREVLFTVVDQEAKYKAKNVIDTVVYRFGDLSAAWMQAGLRAAGAGLLGAVILALGVSAAWGVVAVTLGRRYEALRAGRIDGASN